MIRKDLIIAILATFCLTATMFLITPIRSQTANQYDPWVDVNGDGKIDGKDIAIPALAFGTAGDPTKDVYVTNWVSLTMLAYDNQSFTWDNPLPGVSGGYHDFAAIKTTGFRKLYFSLTGNLTTGPYLCNLTVGWCIGLPYAGGSYRQQIDQYEEFEIGVGGAIGSGWRDIDVKGQGIVIILGDTYANSYAMSYYLTA